MSPVVQVKVSEVWTDCKAEAVLTIVHIAGRTCIQPELRTIDTSGHFFHPPLIVKPVGENQHLERPGHFQVMYSTRFQAADDRKLFWLALCIVKFCSIVHLLKNVS